MVGSDYTNAAQCWHDFVMVDEFPVLGPNIKVGNDDRVLQRDNIMEEQQYGVSDAPRHPGEEFSMPDLVFFAFSFLGRFDNFYDMFLNGVLIDDF